MNKKLVLQLLVVAGLTGIGTQNLESFTFTISNPTALNLYVGTHNPFMTSYQWKPLLAGSSIQTESIGYIVSNDKINYIRVSYGVINGGQSFNIGVVNQPLSFNNTASFISYSNYPNPTGNVKVVPSTNSLGFTVVGE